MGVMAPCQASSMSCNAETLPSVVSEGMPCFRWYGPENNSRKVKWNAARTGTSNNCWYGREQC